MVDSGPDPFAFDDRIDPTENAIGRHVVFPRGATLFAAACCIFFIVAGVAGNLLTVIALSKCRKLRNATTAFVVSLSLADLLFCSVNLPLTAARYIHEAWIFGETWCALFPFVFYGNVAVSLLSMTAITINRYILIAHYRIYDRIYKLRYIALMIAFVWAFSFSMLIPPLAQVWGRLGYNPKTFSCTILSHEGKSPKKFLFVLGFLLPFIVIVLSYSCIYYRIRQSRINLSAHSNSKSPTGRSTMRSEDVRLTRLMFIIFCAFIGCFLPLMLANVLDEDDTKYPWLHVLASILAWASAVINPLIYAVLSRQYRQAYVRLLCFQKARSPNASTVSGRTATTDAANAAFNASTGNVKLTSLENQSKTSNPISNGGVQVHSQNGA